MLKKKIRKFVCQKMRDDDEKVFGRQDDEKREMNEPGAPHFSASCLLTERKRVSDDDEKSASARAI